jgi:hypothetical protein
MAKCVKCGGTFLIPTEEEGLVDEARADDLAIEILEQADDDDDATVPLETVADEHSDERAEPEPTSYLEQVDVEVAYDPPDIGDASTPEEVKELRRERHRLLLTIGMEAHQQVLSPAFDEFKARIKKLDKSSRQVRAWLAAVDRAGGEANPLARSVDMNVDASKAVKRLVGLERDRDHAYRVLGEALISANQHVNICPEERERVQAVQAQLDEIVPPPPTEKKSLLSRFRGG